MFSKYFFCGFQEPVYKFRSPCSGFIHSPYRIAFLSGFMRIRIRNCTGKPWAMYDQSSPVLYSLLYLEAVAFNLHVK